MVKTFFAILVAAGSIAATDIVMSKDSLKVYNNPVSSFADGAQIINTAAAAIHLDSAVIGIFEMDTAGAGQYGLDGRFLVRWRERMNPALYLHWKLELETGSRYRLVRWSGLDAGTIPLDFSGAGETLGVAFLEIGTCLGCSGIPTWYPPCFRGELFLYFSNGQTLSIRLYSEDRRTTPVAAPARRRAEVASSPMIRIRAAHKVLSVGAAYDRITAVALVDLAGKTVSCVHRSGGLEIVLPTGGLARGIYTVALFSGANIAGVRQVLIDR